MGIQKFYERNIGVWSESFQESLWKVTIGVAGLGGAGCCLVDILARNGFGTLKLSDPETYDASNLQRQLFATGRTLGKNKALAAAEHVKAINPNIRVVTLDAGISPDNIEEFLEGCDFVHEVVDYQFPHIKRLIHRRAREKGIVTTTAALIGAGAGLLVFQPDGMGFEEYFHMSNDNDAQRQRHEDIVRQDPDYIDKDYFGRVARGLIPTTADGAYLAGVLTAGAYKRILMGKPLKSAPSMVRFDLLDDQMYRKVVID